MNILVPIFGLGNWAEGYVSPKHFEVGMEVFAPTPPASERKAVKCKVSVAAGDWALVVNEQYEIEEWVRLDMVAIKDERQTTWMS